MSEETDLKQMAKTEKTIVIILLWAQLILAFAIIPLLGVLVYRLLKIEDIRNITEVKNLLLLSSSLPMTIVLGVINRFRKERRKDLLETHKLLRLNESRKLK